MSLKFLIAIPSNTGRQALPAPFIVSFLNALNALKDRPEISYEVRNFGGLRIDAVRLQMVEYARENHHDAIIMVDDDMILPPHALITLICHILDGKDVVAAIYNNKNYPFVPFLSIDGTWLQAYEKDKLYEVAQLGTGCCVIRTSVFDQLPAPAFLLRMDKKGRITCTEDCYFANLCRAFRIQAYVDTGIICDHLITTGVMDFFSHPYVHHKLEVPLGSAGPLMNCIKKPLDDKGPLIPFDQLCAEAVPDLYWIDGVDQCNHERVTVMPRNDGQSQLYKCLECGLITQGARLHG